MTRPFLCQAGGRRRRKQASPPKAVSSNRLLSGIGTVAVGGAGGGLGGGVTLAALTYTLSITGPQLFPALFRLEKLRVEFAPVAVN